MPDRSFRLERALDSDAREIARMRTAVADELTLRFGPGHWSNASSAEGVIYAMSRGQLYVARLEGRIIATLTLQRARPWAIDASYFTPVRKPIYLLAMSVEVGLQRRGLGRLAMVEAERFARAEQAQAIRLDAYDTPAGAGGFYASCGYADVGRVVYRGTPLIYYERLL